MVKYFLLHVLRWRDRVLGVDFVSWSLSLCWPIVNHFTLSLLVSQNTAMTAHTHTQPLTHTFTQGEHTHCRGNAVGQKQVIVSSPCVCVEWEGWNKGRWKLKSRHREKERMMMAIKQRWRTSFVSQMRGNAASYWSLSATTTDQRTLMERVETKWVNSVETFILFVVLLSTPRFDHFTVTPALQQGVEKFINKGLSIDRMK